MFNWNSPKLQSMFWIKIRKKKMFAPSLPSFTIYTLKWGKRGYILHGHVSVMD